MRWSETEYRKAWAASIPPWFAALEPEPAEVKKAECRRRMIDRRRAYADECTPQKEGDAEMLCLLRRGVSIAAIGLLFQMGPGEVKVRIEACHPQRRWLR